MNIEHTVQELEIIISEMRQIQNQHEKAEVLYDPEKRRINITYPLPKDFFELREFKISDEERF